MHHKTPDAALAASVDGALSKARAVTHYSNMAAEALAMVRDSGAAVQRAQYVSALMTHDWHHQHSDDHSVVQRGAAERQALLRMQAAIDPLCAVWNRHCPVDFRRVAA